MIQDAYQACYSLNNGALKDDVIHNFATQHLAPEMQNKRVATLFVNAAIDAMCPHAADKTAG